MGLLDEQLIEGADLLGESRNGFVRIAIEDPLWIHFELHDDHQLVIVTSVRYRPQLQS